ncbi:tRNA (guanosine(18)-2'-O)-methyltransferase-like [Pyrus ussuriensis x Pyrus communis]|uniref:tRNA (guanosine(18)-2'-O)-methyltransferase TARBP1 n=1 Tax=Pyrus ussuriensis x Pyrus communis TaxID=2448454 RepID=A0A5N5H4D6_9ROSA|nr:tRNA (guanosine(18)-2'-O)-methyltransferase-like [Pyrus ussuriensis x Pyrus communis]
MADKLEGFDTRAENEYWDGIKRGLVHKESLVRKQSLHMLKTALGINEPGQTQSFSGGVLEAESHSRGDGGGSGGGMTKRELWADKEAKSLGVGKMCSPVESFLNSRQKWEAFVLLYEMLEEYGTHLVEAAWNFQISLLLQYSTTQSNGIVASSVSGEVLHQNLIESPGEIFSWLAILWERGFHHDNPQVRCLIMQSFLGIDWKNYGNHAKSVPRSFVLGPLMEGLNDPVHHKEFGVKGLYSSVTIEGAARFLRQYTSCLNARTCIAFLINLARTAKVQSFGRVGLMCLAECISSAACQVRTDDNESEGLWLEDVIPGMIQTESAPNDKVVLLDSLRFLIESSKQHFNPNYRLRGQSITDYLHISSFTETKLLKGLHEFPSRFTVHYSVDRSITFDDEDLESWEFEAKRWARVLFLTCQEEYHLIPTLMFIQTHALGLCQENNNLDQIPVKFLIVILSLVRELQMMQDRVAEYRSTVRTKSESRALELMDQFGQPDALNFYQKFTNVFILIMKELVSLANLSCSIFSHANTTKMADASFPGSVKGKLGGPSQRRLSSSTTSAVLQAIISMKALATISSWCAQFIADASLDLAFNFMWEFYWKTVSSPVTDSETGAEISLAAYEALAPALTALVSMFSPKSLDLVTNNGNLFLSDGKPLLDSLVLSFLQNINNLLAIGVFVRTRRAVLMNWKWICLESLLSIPCYALKKGLHLEDNNFLLSGDTLRLIFTDLLESLENAGENSVLPMLRSVRLVLGLLSEGKSGSLIYSCDGVDAQSHSEPFPLYGNLGFGANPSMLSVKLFLAIGSALFRMFTYMVLMMWQLVQSSWILHVSCNKRKVAPIAALLSSVLHSSLFSDESMHMNDNAPGPLKWFVEKILEEGTKSPRTIRLAALHLTGLFLSYPRIIKYYVKELKLLSLHGSVAFDEDFEGELADNHDTRTEVSLLAKGPDPELTKEFINTELYARASVAVLFYKLADLSDMVGSPNENEDCHAALESGKIFLLELLDSAVNDKDLSKELYKKYSAMNNLPAVRQYLETFAINMYLKFPSLVAEQLVPVLRDYEMRPQALSSYVFIAANVILHASQAVQDKHLNELLPPIFPLLTSHHHSLRGFAQLLVYQVLCKLFPPLDSRASGTMTLEKRCFEDLKSYLAKNSDCVRLRASMGGFLDAYSPSSSVTPAGIFINRVEALEFECVPVSLTEQVLNFLNDVREDLRSSMAKDAAAIKNESLRSDEDQNCTAIPSNANEGNSHTQQPKDISLDFQKKITLSKHEKHDIAVNSFFGNQDTYKPLEEMEKEDKLLAQVLQSRSQAMERERASRQQLILVASLLDRIPNLAGLARTCEVFKVSGLAVADANVVHDKQFQLISVTAEKWVPIIEVPVDSLKVFLERKKREGFSILGLEQTANSVPLDQYSFPKKTVLVLGREKEGIPVDIIHILDACIEIPQLGVVRSLNVHVSGAIALWEYTRQQRSSQ